MHLKAIYHRPSYQGGDTARAYCQTGIGVIPVSDDHLTDDAEAVTCAACRRKLNKAALQAA